MNGLAYLIFILFSFIYVQAYPCPNEKDECPQSTTCCQMANGEYGCCPYKNAMCCSDFIHCCPSGSRCDIKDQTCSSSSVFILNDWMATLLSKPLATQNKNDIFPKTPILTDGHCPDGKTCPEHFTCCQLPRGNFGCCPYKQATCCSDREHCCPYKYHCDMVNDRCIKKNSFTNHLGSKVLPIYNFKLNKYEVIKPMLLEKKHYQLDVESVRANLTKVQESSLLREGVLCENKKQICPPENTCCHTSNGGYGCCPLPEGTCCKDERHCCPNGFICTDRSCEKTTVNENDIKKNIETCFKDGRRSCPHGSICCDKQKCKKSVNQNNITKKDGTCCKDERHCCPQGFICCDKQRCKKTTINQKDITPLI